METDQLHLDQVLLKKGALVFRAVNNKLRQQLLHLIHDNKRITVTEIYVKLRIEQSVASQHLAILRRAGVVLTERQGKYIFYTINYQRLTHLHDCAASLIAARKNKGGLETILPINR